MTYKCDRNKCIVTKGECQFKSTSFSHHSKRIFGSNKKWTLKISSLRNLCSYYTKSLFPRLSMYFWGQNFCSSSSSRLDSSPILMWEVPMHIPRQNVAMVVSRMGGFLLPACGYQKIPPNGEMYMYKTTESVETLSSW